MLTVAALRNAISVFNSSYSSRKDPSTMWRRSYWWSVQYSPASCAAICPSWSVRPSAPETSKRSSGAAPDVAAHPLIPEVPLRAGGSFGPLGVDHQLLREGVFLKLLSRGNVRFELENLILMNVCISCLREVSNIFLLAFTARRCFWHFLVVVPSHPQGIANLLSQPERLQDLTAPHVL